MNVAAAAEAALAAILEHADGHYPVEELDTSDLLVGLRNEVRRAVARWRAELEREGVA